MTNQDKINNPKNCPSCGRKPTLDYRGLGTYMIVCNCGLSADCDDWDDGRITLKKVEGESYYEALQPVMKF